MKKNRIRLTESQLNRIVNESVRRVVNPQTVYAVSQCCRATEELFNTIMKEFAHVLETTEYNDMKVTLREWVKLIPKFRDTYPHQIMSIFQPIIDGYIKNNTKFKQYKNRDENYEPEDWYERNEHGDFDTY